MESKKGIFCPSTVLSEHTMNIFHKHNQISGFFVLFFLHIMYLLLLLLFLHIMYLLLKLTCNSLVLTETFQTCMVYIVDIQYPFQT